MPQKDKDFVSLQKFNGLLTMILLYKLHWRKLNTYNKLIAAVASVIFGIELLASGKCLIVLNEFEDIIGHHVDDLQDYDILLIFALSNN